jgi:precorrin-6B methylase 2
MSYRNKRYWWLIDLVSKNGFTIGAEVGCANGATTGRLLRFCKNLKLYAVDKWEKIDAGAEGGAMNHGPGCESWDPVLGFERFNKETNLHRDRLTVLRGDSSTMAAKVPDNSLDFVFIDADHRYPAVIKDLAAWAPKLKPGGILCGHDIHLAGVKKAVDEKMKWYEDVGVDHCWWCKKEDYVD